jgi:hypothetical protein
LEPEEEDEEEDEDGREDEQEACLAAARTVSLLRCT